jgi:hypothetical protein
MKIINYLTFTLNCENVDYFNFNNYYRVINSKLDSIRILTLIT